MRGNPTRGLAMVLSFGVAAGLASTITLASAADNSDQQLTLGRNVSPELSNVSRNSSGMSSLRARAAQLTQSDQTLANSNANQVLHPTTSTMSVAQSFSSSAMTVSPGHALGLAKASSSNPTTFSALKSAVAQQAELGQSLTNAAANHRRSGNFGLSRMSPGNMTVSPGGNLTHGLSMVSSLAPHSFASLKAAAARSESDQNLRSISPDKTLKPAANRSGLK